jgi:hypothetical protein
MKMSESTTTYDERMKLTSPLNLSPSDAALWRREMMQRIITDPARFADLLLDLFSAQLQEQFDYVRSNASMQRVIDDELSRRAVGPR